MPLKRRESGAAASSRDVGQRERQRRRRRHFSAARCCGFCCCFLRLCCGGGVVLGLPVGGRSFRARSVSATSGGPKDGPVRLAYEGPRQRPFFRVSEHMPALGVLRSGPPLVGARRRAVRDEQPSWAVGLGDPGIQLLQSYSLRGKGLSPSKLPWVAALSTSTSENDWPFRPGCRGFSSFRSYRACYTFLP